MKKNMGRTDRTVRLVAAAVFAVLLIADVLHGTLAIVAAILAAIFVITTFVGFCPAYAPFGLSTRRRGETDETCSR